MNYNTIVVAPPIFPDVLEELRRHARVVDNQSGTPLDAMTLAARLAEADGLLAFALNPVTAEVLAAAPGLRVVANIGVGYDNIDVAACNSRGVIVTNTPGVVDDATADLAFGLMLAAARRIVEGDRFVREGSWTPKAQLPMGLDVHHRTLGIVGFGRIGRAIARRAVGFDMTVLYHNRRRLEAGEETTLGVSYASLEDLLEKADFIVLQVPGTAETRHLIGAAELARMKRTAVLVNTARGGVVDEQALVEALKRGRIAAAGLDVFEGEPDVNPDLRNLPNVVLAPHVGSATLATRHAMVWRAARNLLAVLAGQEPPDRVRS
ncbi:MAG: D-glycerate dehydrogenase [Gammaproteobacteria bacterium]|nr:D-glycerate dehydrogenase [Gammaproteobacteria bacterium]